MIKHLTKISGVAAFAVVASTVSAEVKINENLSLDGYAIGSYVVTEPTVGANDAFLDSGRVFDSTKIALNGKYDAFTAKVSLYTVNSSKESDLAGNADAGLLDAYVTYKNGNVAATVGKYLGWLGFESFDSPNNAFISYGFSDYSSPYATGAKLEYIADTFSTGISVRDSQMNFEPFFKGDAEYSDDLGYEAYFLYTGIDKLTVFVGAGYEDVDGNTNSSSTYNIWASYALTDKLSVAAEYTQTEDGGNHYTWLTQASYAVTSNLSVAARLTGADAETSEDGFGYGVASTYTITSNFAVKGEVTKVEDDTDSFQYAIQGLFKF